MYIKISKTLIVTFCLLFIIKFAYGQDIDSVSYSKNTFYLNLTNKGALYSINYDRIFYESNKLTYSYTLGFSILENAVGLPIRINIFTGKKSSHLEFSLTAMVYVDKYKSYFTETDLSDKYIYIMPRFGYRYQKPDGYLFFKALLSPMLVLDPRSSNFWKMDPVVYASASIGVGLSF